ncbi:MAG: hypothetical protein A2Z95_02755 [Gallionellales bacterium GWA2_60_18]|nr:MAG: hypothetical protein A2Z95_02755 [Gallionellales bacterium GWA2_60_18]
MDSGLTAGHFILSLSKDRNNDYRGANRCSAALFGGAPVLSGRLCCMLKRNFPAWKHEYSRMALEGTSKNLCALDS